MLGGNIVIALWLTLTKLSAYHCLSTEAGTGKAELSEVAGNSERSFTMQQFKLR